MADWYYGINNQTYGPVSKAVLGQLFSGGQINRQTLVVREGIPDWQPLEKVSELRDICGAPIPQPQAQAASAPAGMVRINGGTFTMGSHESEHDPKYRYEDHANRVIFNEIQHQVTLSPFYMGTSPVTQGEWFKVMGTTVQQHYEKMDWLGGRLIMTGSSFPGVGDTYPMYYVHWYDAIEFCNARSLKEGLTPVYTIDKSRKDPNNFDNDKVNITGDDSLKWLVTWNRNANGYRLPTEAEWEYACRAGTTTVYHTGVNKKDAYPWDHRTATMLPAGSIPANAWGLGDYGSMIEWCWDWLGFYQEGAQTDPAGPVSGCSRVVRGRYFGNIPRSAERGKFSPVFRYYYLGFRIARNG